MANDDIEKYLVAKLNEALQALGEADQPLQAKLLKLRQKFKELKGILEDENREAPHVREKLYTLKNLLSEWQMHLKKKKHAYSWKSLPRVLNFNKKVEKITFVYNFKQNLDKITEELKSQTPPPGAGQSTPPTTTGEDDQGYRWSDRLVDEKKVYGIDDKALSLQKSLVLRTDSEDRRFSMIGIVGMRGVGKTTLAQVVFNKTEVKGHFLPRIWVCVSKQPGDDSDHRIEIVKRMLTCLGVEETTIESANNEHELKGLLFALRLQLTGKRYLIVLDDVWSEEAQYEGFCSSLEEDENKCSEKLAYGLPKGYGGAVIVTSRREGFVKKMVGEENSHKVLPLKDPESSWLIFKDSAGENYTELDGLKEKIIDKCAGLPLAARMMGQIAREPPVPKKTAAVLPPVPENVRSEQTNAAVLPPVPENPPPVPENLPSEQTNAAVLPPVPENLPSEQTNGLNQQLID